MKKYSGSFAKVTPPSLTNIYHRERLFDLMDWFRKRPVIWVAGPAGCGKTTFVSSYAKIRELVCLWYQVDPGDADPATFFYYLGLAAQKAARQHPKPLPLLTPEYIPGLPVFSLQFFEELYRRLKIPGFIVFDNFQELPDDSSLPELLLSGLSLLPKGLNVILISRKSPPAVFARLQANQQMQIIGPDELRLTLGETTGVVRLHRREKISEQAIKNLHRRSEGWAAGLILMMVAGYSNELNLQSEDLETPEVVFDYFAGEVLNGSKKNIEAFLLKTALAPTISIRLAKALTGSARAGKILARLSRDNYFITKHVGRIATYQYHQLFKEFLNSLAETTMPRETLSNLRRKAACILEEEGEIEAAAELFLSTNDWDTLAAFIIKHAPSLLAQGRYDRLNKWLQRFPAEKIQNTPWLLYWQGACNLFVNPSSSRQSFEKTFHQFRSHNDPAGMLMAWAGVVDAIEFQREDFSAFDDWISEFDKLSDVYQTLPNPEIQAHVACRMLKALIYRQPQHTDMEKWREQAHLPPSDTFAVNIKAHLLVMLMAYYLTIKGKVKKAEQILLEAHQLLSLPFITPFGRLIVKQIEIVFHLGTGNHVDCRKAVIEGFELARVSGIGFFNVSNSAHLITDLLNTNDIRPAQRRIQKMGASIGTFNSCDKIWYYFLKARAALIAGELRSAVVNTETALDLSIKLGWPHPIADHHLFYSQVLHAAGRHQEAKTHLAEAHRLIRHYDLCFTRLMYLLTQSYFALELGNARLGLKLLRKGLKFGQDLEIIPQFLDQPAVTAKLCALALENEIAVDYVRQIIQKRNLTLDPAPLHLDSWPWPVKIQMFGRFNLAIDDKPVQFSRKVQQKPLDLLKVLVACGGIKVKEEQIADVLWPETDGDLAHRSFTTTLHRLRKLIGYPRAIHLVDHRITLDQRYCWIDTWAFERIYDRLEMLWKARSKDDGKYEKAIRLAHGILELYRGHFLHDESWAGCFISQREKLKRRFLDVVWGLGQYWEANGQWKKAIACYHSGLEKDELAEDLYCRLMVCFGKLGQRAEAIRAYDRCKKLLSVYLGRAPSRQIKNVYEAMRSQ